jgi:hypothetical protein
MKCKYLCFYYKTSHGLSLYFHTKTYISIYIHIHTQLPNTFHILSSFSHVRKQSMYKTVHLQQAYILSKQSMLNAHKQTIHVYIHNYESTILPEYTQYWHRR